MKMTLKEYYEKNYTNYYLMFDNKGKMLEGKGIIPYQVCKKVEKIVKNSITKRQKNNYCVRAVYFKDKLTAVYKITQSDFNRARYYISL